MLGGGGIPGIGGGNGPGFDDEYVGLSTCDVSGSNIEYGGGGADGEGGGWGIGGGGEAPANNKSKNIGMHLSG